MRILIVGFNSMCHSSLSTALTIIYKPVTLTKTCLLVTQSGLPEINQKILLIELRIAFNFINNQTLSLLCCLHLFNSNVDDEMI